MMRVLSPGLLTTVQDLGRPGLAHLGVPRSGAADLPALRLANRLLGNRPDAAALEVTDGGLELEVEAPTAVVLTGAVVPAQVDGLPLDLGTPVLLRAGAVLCLGRPERGLRTYLGVRGGVEVPPVLGSRSFDVLSRLGPPPLAPGDRVTAGDAVAGEPAAPVAIAEPPAEPVLDVLPGPRPSLFTADVLDALAAARYTVTGDADRVGVRLAGPALERSSAGRSAPPSEGLADGAVQVPPDGRPVLFLADHPVTGGYPVVAVLTPEGLAAAAQLRPGQAVRLRALPSRVGPPH